MSSGYGIKFEKALLFANRVHAGQWRKGTRIPYITHLLAVAAIVGEHGGNEDEVAAALLHDTIEDTPTTREDLAVRFGEDVASIVAGCSDADTIPKPPWRERKESHIERMRHASRSVRLVSAADKLHNARSILTDLRTCGEVVFRRFHGGREGTLWYYRTLARVFEETDGGPLADELARVVQDIEALSKGSHPTRSTP
ncbi:HD domain-containing protein [Rubrobacter calidifluminis]|uniref:HD domain-containing protein n=1 Tax=Rubrobacter calidifluminis TaxID=1392640 RepID=UPI00235EC3C0|nr:HD domain-containing protein [Rubrobacter calidifluminis]